MNQMCLQRKSNKCSMQRNITHHGGNLCCIRTKVWIMTKNSEEITLVNNAIGIKAPLQIPKTPTHTTLVCNFIGQVCDHYEQVQYQTSIQSLNMQLPNLGQNCYPCMCHIRFTHFTCKSMFGKIYMYIHCDVKKYALIIIFQQNMTPNH